MVVVFGDTLFTVQVTDWSALEPVIAGCTRSIVMTGKLVPFSAVVIANQRFEIVQTFGRRNCHGAEVV